MANSVSGGPVVRFADFELDLESGDLTQNASRVLLPDQPFRLLAILVRGRGALVTREDLRRELWPEGTFVDFEPSLNAAVKRVREALGDSATAPRFIETLPRRGYRFIAPVQEVSLGRTEELPALPSRAIASSPEASHMPGSVRTPAAGAPKGVWARVRVDARWKPVALVLASAIAVAAIGVFQRSSRRLSTDGAQPVIERVTDVGSVQLAAISLDGRQVAYVRREGVRESLWLKRADDSLSSRLLAPADGTYKSLTFVPGDFLHYTLFRPDRTLIAPFSISTTGGQPAPMLEPAGRISFDRQGSRFAYVASFSLSQRESRIVVSDAIGSEARVLAVRRPPESFVRTKPAWSPDGSRLAVFGVSEISPASLDLLVLDAGTGRLVNIGAIDLIAVDSALWLPDGERIIVAGRSTSATPQRLWVFSPGSGSLRPLTADLSDYSLVGFWQNTGQIVAVRSDVARSIWTAELKASHAVRQVAQNSGDLGELEGLAWSGDDHILYTGSESGNVDIWSVNVDGTARHQLTNDPADDFHPSATADGRTIVFASSRGEARGIWSMNGDGSEQRRMTIGTDVRPSVSRDGRLVVFQRGAVDTMPFTLWRLPTGHHEPVQVSDHHAMRPAISPDNQSIAHYLMTAEAWMLAMTPIAGGPPDRTIPISQTHATRVVRWSPDGRALAYIDGLGGASNIWVQPLDGGSADRVTHFTEGRITTFDWSPSGSHLAWIRVNEVRDVVLIDLPGAQANE